MRDGLLYLAYFKKKYAFGLFLEERDAALACGAKTNISHRLVL